MTIVKVALAATFVCVATLANAFEPVTYWERHDYGQYSTYGDSRVGLWNLGRTTINDYVYYGQSQACQYGSTSCTQTFSQAATFTWSYAVGVTYQQTIVPLEDSISITSTYTEGRSYTDTNSYAVTVAPGKKSQYAEYVPRRAGSATVYGVRVATGATREDCTHQGPLHCYKHEKSWQYYNDPTRIASVIYANKNLSDPIHTFIISSL